MKQCRHWFQLQNVVPVDWSRKELNMMCDGLRCLLICATVKSRTSHANCRTTKNWKSFSLWRIKTVTDLPPERLPCSRVCIICRTLVSNLNQFKKSVIILNVTTPKNKKSSFKFVPMITVHFDKLQIHWVCDSTCPTLTCSISISIS